MEVMRRTLPIHALIALLVLALTSAGFAHRFASPSQLAAMQFAQTYGIDASDICGGSDSSVASHECEACLLQSAMSIPDPAFAAIMVELALCATDWTPRLVLAQSIFAEAQRPARAPPAV